LEAQIVYDARFVCKVHCEILSLLDSAVSISLLCADPVTGELKCVVRVWDGIYTFTLLLVVM